MAASGTRSSRTMPEVCFNVVQIYSILKSRMRLDKAMEQQGNIHLRDLIQVVKPQAKGTWYCFTGIRPPNSCALISHRPRRAEGPASP